MSIRKNLKIGPILNIYHLRNIYYYYYIYYYVTHKMPNVERKSCNNAREKTNLNIFLKGKEEKNAEEYRYIFQSNSVISCHISKIYHLISKYAFYF